MIWLAFLGLSALALFPLVPAFRRPGRLRGRREAAIALHRAQLAELKRERAEERIGKSEYCAAKLEIERRLLAAAEETETAGEPRRFPPGPLIAAAVLVPFAALALYVPGGRPNLPAARLAARITAAKGQEAEAKSLVAALKAKLATLPLASAEARRGFLLLARVEFALGDLTQAAAAWRNALKSGFDPNIAVLAAETETIATGHVSARAAALFRRALAQAPPDASWRNLVEKRLAEAKEP